MTKHNPQALRAARKKRLAEKHASGPQSQNNFQFTQEPAASTAPVGGQIMARVLNPAEIDKSANFQMHLFGKDSADPHWMLTANGQPVAEIRLSDQDDVEKVARLFTTDQYATSIIEASKQIDIAEILAGVKARPYFAALASSEAFKHMQEGLVQEAKQEVARKAASVRTDLLNVLNLVITAGEKNYITENALKDSLFRRMTASGIESDRATSVIEGSWQESAQEYFEACFAKAAEWADLHPQAFAEMQEQITGMKARMPKVEVDHQVAASYQHTPTPSASSNVPFMTGSAAAGTEKTAGMSDKDELKSRMGFRQRHLNHGAKAK